jgi:hypothetical protein
MKTLLLTLILVSTLPLAGQGILANSRRLTLMKNPLVPLNSIFQDHELYVDSLTGEVYIIGRSSCKYYSIQRFKIPEAKQDTAPLAVVEKEQISPGRKFLQLKGMISYEYYSNNRIDTPFSSKGFRQHTETVQLQVTVNDKYPFQLAFTSRQSNSDFFRNFIEPTFSFDKYAYLQKQKDQYLQKWKARSLTGLAADELSSRLKKLDSRIRVLDAEVNDQKYFQRIVSERETMLRQIHGLSSPSDRQPFAVQGRSFKDYVEPLRSVINDSTVNVSNGGNKWPLSSPSLDSAELNAGLLLPKTPTEKWLESQSSIQDVYKSQRAKLLYYSDSLRSAILQEEQSLRDAFGNKKKWKEHLQKYGGKEEANNRFLSDVREMGIGRNNIDYSDLTIKNISLTGLRFEYEPRLYYAFAAGKVDYRFRDFLVNNRQPEQQYYILRAGNNYESRRGVIASIFRGQKNSFQGATNVQSWFSGYSLEAFWNVDRASIVSVELAKTTTPKTGNIGNKNTGLLDFGKSDNLGVTAKLHLTSKRTNTILEGYFRRMGNNFQSINYFTAGQQQQAWNIRAEQILFNHSLTVSAMLRQNDITSPYVNQNFSVKTIFKSLTLSFRKRKWSFVNLGYYPGTQLIKTDSGFTENVYYLVNATGGYTCQFRHFSSSTILNFNRYINQSTDAGFINYQGYSGWLNEIINTGKLSLQFGAGTTKQKLIHYYTLEAGCDMVIGKLLSLGASAKFNRVISGSMYWGGKGHAMLSIPYLGTICVAYDKMFIPDQKGKLSNADVGRLTWTKYF